MPDLPEAARELLDAWDRSDAADHHAALVNLRAALADPDDGWVRVPREITEAMHVAAVRTIVKCTGNDDFPRRVWVAMLAAATTQKAHKMNPEKDVLTEERLRVAFEEEMELSSIDCQRYKKGKDDYTHEIIQFGWECWQAAARLARQAALEEVAVAHEQKALAYSQCSGTFVEAMCFKQARDDVRAMKSKEST